MVVLLLGIMAVFSIPQMKGLYEQSEMARVATGVAHVRFAAVAAGVVAGGAIGALSKASEKLGISRKDLESIRDEVTEGTSALFVVTEEGNLDRLGERFRGMNMKLLQTNLTPAEQEDLLETFGGR